MKDNRTALMEVCNIKKSFGRNMIALNNVSLSVYSAEVLCLLGDNGAGKSTLIKILSGVFRPDSGQLFFEGKSLSFTSSRDAINIGIRTVYQDLAIFPLMSIAENFVVGSEPTVGWGPFKTLDIKKMHQIARAGLEKIGVNIAQTSRAVSTLSGGQRQTVAIARAEHLGAKLLILDEPTSALGVKEAAIVLKFIKDVKNRGTGIILITHNVTHAMTVGDRFAVLNHGDLVGIYDKSEVDEAKLIHLMAGGEELTRLREKLNRT
ncbi:MAG: ATP-binding cassette domain-containing protein [Actinobacteria bacterium]|nr:ATP-binding cassette domain-containing protein [Actinomycetota bacterium]